MTATALKSALLAGLGLVLAVFVYQMDAIPQDSAYHAFADQRSLLGIPNFLNVVSNLGFVVVGALGLRVLARCHVRGGLPELCRIYRLFFLGLLLVGAGSAFYHWEPSNTTLVWDRLPMSLAFMAFFSAMIGERISVTAGRRLLVPLLLAGVLAVAYWHLSEQNGAGDLRPYVLVQFSPMLLVPLMLVLFRGRPGGSGWLWAMLLAYAASKVAESSDAAVLELTGVLSGHTLKHLLAAAGGLLFLGALLRRPPGKAVPY